MRRLSNILTDKYEELFIITSNTSHLNVTFNQPIELDLDRKYKLGLKYFSVYNSIRNITEKNNKCRILNGNSEFENIVIPPGSYEISMINNYFENKFGKNKDGELIIEFKPRLSLNKVELIYRGAKVIDFNVEDSLAPLLGFEKKVYKEKNNIAPNRANIENDVSSINIQCNIIDGGYFNKSKKNILYSIPIGTVPLGYRINEKPFQTLYLPLNTSTLKDISLYIKDGHDRLIDFSGEEITIHLHLKQI